MFLRGRLPPTESANSPTTWLQARARAGLLVAVIGRGRQLQNESAIVVLLLSRLMPYDSPSVIA